MSDKRRRYKQADNNPKKEYQRLTRNTKQKMKYVKDKWGIDLSYEIEIPKYSELDTAEKFDEFSEQMRSFTDRGNLDYQFGKNKWGIVYSMAELQEGIENTEAYKEKAQDFIDRFKEKKYSIGGKEQPYTIGDRMIMYKKENVAGITVPDDFDIDAFQSRSRLEGRLELLEEKAEGKFFDRSMRQMKENFMRTIKASFNSVGDELIDMMEIMPDDDFFELFLMKAEFNFEDYASDGSIDGTEEQAELLKGYLQGYFKGEMEEEMSMLKGFYLQDRTVVNRKSKFAKEVMKKHKRE